ncbi:hypothetical protein TRIUR3_16998 [Triticum urartu]|uniref:Uncharacterized protein n=1 Tax=Triticum urartu TaxID=4572 RepID=M7ZMY5_TRIUA|nr:hypothetical protein TRIUR3_16998 [Triticum urartu]
MGNPVDKYFKRMNASQCALQVLLTQRWFRELDEWLDSQGSACDAYCKSLPYWCPASALCFDIKAVVNYASYNGDGEGASMAVDSCLRILEFVPLNCMPRSIQKVLVDVCLEQKEKTLVCEHCEKPGLTEDESDEWRQWGSDSGDESDEWQQGSSDSEDESDEWQRVGPDSDDSLETRGEKQAQIDLVLNLKDMCGYMLYLLLLGSHSAMLPGTYVGSSALVFHGLTDPTTLEALACREATALVKDLRITNICVASDCLSVVNDIHTGTLGITAPVVKEINNIAIYFLSCSFIHEGRLSNKEAHSLARHTLHLDEGRHVWFFNPFDTAIISVIRTIDQ